MKYQGTDELPEGFWQASDEEQAEYYRSRAKHQIERFDRRNRATTRRYNKTMAAIRRANEELTSCDHRRTKVVHIAPSETESGIALDGDTVKVCLNCPAILQGVLA